MLALVGYGTKMGLAPLHTWKPDAYGESPGVIGALLAGGVTSCAFLALLRIFAVVAAAGELAFARKLMLGMGLLSMLWAAVFMVRQLDIRRLLAYSSVEHMGILAFGIGIGGRAVVFALFHLAANALVKGVLFMSAGNINRSYASKRLPYVTGAIRRTPVSGWLFFLGFLAITGTPPFAPFISEFNIAAAALARPSLWAGAAFLVLLGRHLPGHGRHGGAGGVRHAPRRPGAHPVPGHPGHHRAPAGGPGPDRDPGPVAARAGGRHDPPRRQPGGGPAVKDALFALLRNGQALPLDQVPDLAPAEFRAAVVGRRPGRPAPGVPVRRPGPGPVRGAGRGPGRPAPGGPHPPGRPRYPALTPDCPQAHLFERELAEQFGIVPEGHPWFKPVRFHASWVPDRDAWGRTGPIDPAVTDFYQVKGEEVHEVAVGPVHAGVIEPGHFRFQCHGETVFHLEIALGYQHRGIERALAAGPTR